MTLLNQREYVFDYLKPEIWYTFAVTVLMGDQESESNARTIVTGFNSKFFMSAWIWIITCSVSGDPVAHLRGSTPTTIDIAFRRDIFTESNGIIQNFSIIVAEDYRVHFTLPPLLFYLPLFWPSFSWTTSTIPCSVGVPYRTTKCGLPIVPRRLPSTRSRIPTMKLPLTRSVSPRDKATLDKLVTSLFSPRHRDVHCGRPGRILQWSTQTSYRILYQNTGLYE